MSGFTPGPVTVLSPSSAFSAEPIDFAFDKLAEWSTDVGDYTSQHFNIKNNSLVKARKLRPGTTSKVWTSEYSGYNAYMLWVPGNITPDKSPVGGDDLENGEYDVPGASLNFYLREPVAAKHLLMRSSVPLWKACERGFYQSGNHITNATFEVRLSVLTGSVGTRRGLGLNFCGANNIQIEKGLHRFKVRMTFTVTRSASSLPLDNWLFNHFNGTPPLSSVTAIYK